MNVVSVSACNSCHIVQFQLRAKESTISDRTCQMQNTRLFDKTSLLLP